MAITIDWKTFIISIPKADMTLIQLTPVEIRELNINAFRLILKDIEDDADGMGFPKTHDHYPEVSVGGVTLARVINLLEPYTVTFEDGQYAVNLTGANSNIGDKVNVNQVSVRSANSAGLISNAAIEYSSFNGGVTVDEDSPYSGTTFPVGTPQRPVNNLTDAMLIASVRGFSTIYIVGDMVIDADGDYQMMTFVGESMTRSTLDISPDANVENCEFYEATITGTLDGNTKLKNCRILDLHYIYGVVEECMLGPGTIVLGGAEEAHFLDCWSGVVGTGLLPMIDCGGSGQELALRNYNGGLKISNKTGPEKIAIDLNSGEIVLDETVTDGEIIIRGIGTLVDNSLGSAIVDTDALINSTQISRFVWDESVADHTVPGSSGSVIRHLAYNSFVWIDVVNGVPGTTFPAGTESMPVNNLANALTIAAAAGLRSLRVHGVLILTESVAGYLLCGASNVTQDIIICNGQNVNKCFFELVTVSGAMIGAANWSQCLLSNITGLTGVAIDTAIDGTFELGDLGTAFLGKNLSGMSVPVVIDLVGPGRVFQAETTGVYEIRNSQSSCLTSVTMNSGEITFASSCTAGSAIINGNNCHVTNNGTISVLDYTLGGRHGSGNWEGAGAAGDIADAVWDEARVDHTDTGTFGAVSEWSGTGSGDPAAIAAAVWNALATTYGVPGTMGWLQNLIDNGIIRVPEIKPGP